MLGNNQQVILRGRLQKRVLHTPKDVLVPAIEGQRARPWQAQARLITHDRPITSEPRHRGCDDRGRLYITVDNADISKQELAVGRK